VTQNADGEPALIVSTDGQYKYVGRLLVNFDDTGVLQLDSPDPETIGPWPTASRDGRIVNLGEHQPHLLNPVFADTTRVLTVPTIFGWRYEVQVAESLAGPWQALPAFTGAGGAAGRRYSGNAPPGYAPGCADAIDRRLHLDVALPEQPLAVGEGASAQRAVTHRMLQLRRPRTGVRDGPRAL
jgi:hypothetical protein